MFLQSMREKTQSIFAYIIVGFLILSFALWGISSYFNGGFNNGTAAKVNGKKISYQNFMRAVNSYNRDQQIQLGANYQPTEEEQLLIKRHVLKLMTSRVAISEYINEQGFAISQKQLDEKLFAIPIFQKDHEFSPALFKQYLQSRGVGAQAFINEVSSGMLMSQWSDGILNSSFITGTELDRQVSLLQQTRDIAYAVIPMSLKDIAKPSNAEVEVFYRENKGAFVTPEKVKLAYVELDLSELKDALRPTEKELQEYYRKNVTRYSQPEQWKVNIITVSMKKDQDAKALAEQAEAVADQLSNGKPLPNESNVTMAQQGVWLRADSISDSVKSLLVLMKKKGQVTVPISMENGYAIYQVDTYKAAKDIKFEDVKDKVLLAYKQDKASKKYESLVEQMTNIAYEQPGSLAGVSKVLDIPIKYTEYFSADGGSKGITSEQAVVAAAFSDDVLVGMNNSEVIKLGDGKAVVFRIDHHEVSNEKPLSEVRNEIVEHLMKDAARNKTKAFAKQIKLALKDQSISKVEQAFAVKFVDKKAVGRFTKLENDGVLQLAFSLPVNGIDIVPLDDDSYAVVKVLAVTPGRLDAAPDEELEMSSKMLTSEWSQATLFAYSSAVIDAAKITINDDVLTQP